MRNVDLRIVTKGSFDILLASTLHLPTSCSLMDTGQIEYLNGSIMVDEQKRYTFRSG